MGQTKDELIRLQEESDYAEATALDIAIEAGVIKLCSLHNTPMREGGVDTSKAYRLANAYITNEDPLVADTWTSQNRSDLTDAIKSVCDNAFDSCHECAKLEKE